EDDHQRDDVAVAQRQRLADRAGQNEGNLDGRQQGQGPGQPRAGIGIGSEVDRWEHAAPTGQHHPGEGGDHWMDPSGPVGQPTLADVPALSERPDAPALRRSSATPANASRPNPSTPTGTAVRAVRPRTWANVAVSGIGPTPLPPCWAACGPAALPPLPVPGAPLA